MKIRFPNLFVKTFSLMMGMLMGITLVICALIYALIPSFYQSFKMREYQQLFNDHVAALEEANHLIEEILHITEFLLESPASFTLFNEYGTALHLFDQNLINNLGVQSFHNITILPSSPSDRENIYNIEWSLPLPEVRVLGGVWQDSPYLETELTHLDFNYFNQGHLRTLRISVPVQPLTDARHVIINIFPIAALISIGSALVLSWIFSRWFTIPIKRIQAAASRMANIEPNVVIPVATRDEIGDLSRDINSLYEQLRSTIVSLENEIKRYADVENKKIEFLQTVTHEMKTPLASANALIEGILYDIPPYNENPKKHLEDCRLFLEKTILLTKESLRLSQDYKQVESPLDLKSAIQEVSSLYQVILRSKQITYTETIPCNLVIQTKSLIFMKVLSNIFSNAANHTPRNGEIKIWYSKGVLYFSNSCLPLSENTRKNLFEPLNFTTSYQHSTGLGLFIVKQLLRQLNIPFSFLPNSESNGMTFTLDLNGLQH